MQGRSVPVLGVISLFAGLLTAGTASWKTKPTAQWTQMDAEQVLTTSPWAKEITAGIARRLTEDELREAGMMGEQHGIGYDGVDLKVKGEQGFHSTVRFIRLRLRWETALPVRVAGLVSHEIEPPTLDGDGYQLAVYGIPGAYFKGDPKKLGDPLKNDALLRREGKKDVKPSRVEVFEADDGLVVVYLFPLSAEISPKDRQIDFEARIGRVIVSQVFDLSQMVFQGKLEL